MKFTGQQKDGSTTGLDFFNARYLSGAQGRFTSADPGNAGASLGDPQSWNGYAYVNNNPLNLTDPSGMDAGGFAFCGGGPIACGIGIGIDVGLALWKIFGGGGQSTPVTIPRNGPELWNEQPPVGLNTGSVFGGCGLNGICNFEKLERVQSLGPNPVLDILFPSSRSRSKTQRACPAVPTHPANASLAQNISSAKQSVSMVLAAPRLNWFYNQVRNKGPWDYKQQGRAYQNFGNFNFGATGAAAGIQSPILLRGAGYAQEQAGTSTPSWGHWYNFRGPFGDDPADQEQIKNGIAYYQNGCK